jgi:hypothetical protein
MPPQSEVTRHSAATAFALVPAALTLLLGAGCAEDDEREARPPSSSALTRDGADPDARDTNVDGDDGDPEGADREDVEGEGVEGEGVEGEGVDRGNVEGDNADHTALADGSDTRDGEGGSGGTGEGDDSESLPVNADGHQSIDTAGAEPDASPAADDDLARDPARDATPEPENAGDDTAPNSSIDTVVVNNPLTSPEAGPAAGNPDAACNIPSEAGLAHSSTPDHVIGDGTPESCTADAVVDAVALGGVITFDCGASPHTIVLDRPAKIVNNSTEEIVIDGGGLVTLSGGGSSRILYMNTCDPDQVYTTEHCDNQDHPRLTVQNLTFVDGNSNSEEEYDGGGAIWVRGGRFKLVNTRFFNNTCANLGPDVGGAGVRVFSQFDSLPVYLVNSTFGGADGYGNVCSNGGGISSIGVSWSIYNSLFTHNRAVGNGGNPAEDGTPGGGSGGAIYNDGGTMTLHLCGTRIEANAVNAYGSGIFFVSNNHDGTIRIEQSVVQNNTGGGWNVLPGISMHDDTTQIIEDSIIE